MACKPTSQCIVCESARTTEMRDMIPGEDTMENIQKVMEVITSMHRTNTEVDGQR